MKRIYLITNNINGMKYIGKTKQTLESRMWYHIHNKCNTKMHEALMEYGPDNFSIKLLEEVDDIGSIEKEKEYTLKYDTLWPKGYNVMLGQSLKGGNNRMKGKHLSKEWAYKCGRRGIKNGRACKWCIHWLDTDEKIIVNLRESICDIMKLSICTVKKFTDRKHIDSKTKRPVVWYNIGKVSDFNE